MSPSSAGRAEKLGYTNIKVYHDGLPEWTKRNSMVLTPKFLKEAFMDKDIPHVLIDVRSAESAKNGFIKGAVTMPAAELAANIVKFPPKEKKPPLIIYDQNDGNDAKTAARSLTAAGYTSVLIMTGGIDGWQKAGLPVQSGSLETAIVYVPKLRQGELSIEDFKKAAADTPADMLILDVRNREECGAGMLKGAKNIPDEEVLDRLSEIPKDKKIIAHCSTGVRAEMAYHKLKEKGYAVQFVNAKLDIDKDGMYQIERP